MQTDMTSQEMERLRLLQNGPCMPLDYIREYYGLAWPFDADLQHDFDIWRAHVKMPKDCGADCFSRYEIEAFMREKRVVTKKWMAAILGMRLRSFDALLEKLDDLGLRRDRYIPYRDMVALDLAGDIVPAMPGLRFRTFSDQNSFCMRLHEDIEAVLSLKIEPMYCETSTKMQEEPREFAKHFDCLTLDPLSVKHTVWLDFHKPLFLGPDRCSKLFFADHEDELRQLRAGSSDPEDLDSYEQFRAARRNGDE